MFQTPTVPASIRTKFAVVLFFASHLGALPVAAATFTNLARVEISDSSGLSWDNDAKALTVSCWFRLIIPSDARLTENMTVLVNANGASDGSEHSYLVQFNVATGNIDFSTRGAAGFYSNILIQRPYLERWYQVTVVRQGEVFTGYVDGRQVFSNAGNVGAVSGGTLQIGGWGNGRYLLGEVQEVNVYQGALTEPQIQDRMFKDQSGFQRLTGYYKLGFTTNETVRLYNFAPGKSNHGTKQGTGTISFDETDQAGEQSLFDARKNQGENALVPLSGAFSWEQTALARPTPGIAFDFRFGYSSANTSPGAKIGSLDPYANPALGLGWRHTFETRLIPEPFVQEIRVLQWNGAIDTWFSTNNTFRTRHKEYRGELVQVPGAYEWTTPERIVYRFRDFQQGLIMSGRLSEIRDFNGNKVQIQWNQDEGLITNVVDTVGGRFALLYDSRNLLTNVNFQGWSANFTYDQTNRLSSKSITGPSEYATSDTKWQFLYHATNGLLDRIVDPRGITNLFVAYDEYGRRTNLVDALNRTNRTEYGVPGKRQLRQTDPAGFQWIETYDRKGHILVQEDPLHNKTSYTYDEHGNRTSITESLGFTTYFGYDERANVVSRTNALEQVSRWLFHPLFNKAVQEITPQPRNANGWTTWTNFYELNDFTGNLLRHFDALTNLVRYSYRTNGLVETSIDGNGNTSRFLYNTNGFLAATIDPDGFTNSVLLNEVGWKLGETNALGQVTSFTLDVNGHRVRIQDPLLRMFTNTFDGLGNLLSASDGKGKFTFNFYDAASQRTQTVDRAGFTNRFFYTSRGSLERVTDALGNTATNFYDAANRLERSSDPLGGTVTNFFDANGRIHAFTDKTGRRWLKRYDWLSRVIEETDPEQNASGTKYDVAGRIQEIRSPNGFPSTHEYDGRGRLTTWTDPERFEWKYQYDGNGNIVDIEDALHGHYVMEYGKRNQRTLERNQDGKEWRYTYDALLRLKAQTDPNGVERTTAHDDGGRLLSVSFSSGRMNSLQYDPNNNPTNLTRIKGSEQTTLRLEYDAVDRPTSQIDLATSLRVEYGRDPLGGVTNLIYPGNILDSASKPLQRQFDAIGRLTNLVDWAGREMSFQYDPANRLIRRVYPNGIVQTNSFDKAGRITALSYSSLNAQPSTLNLALTYAYDRNGNKTNWTETGTLAWTPPAAYDERSGFTASGRITNRVDALNPSRSFAYQFDPSGNMTNCVGGGESFALVYDEDNRVTLLNWANTATNKSIVNRYDAFGRRIERTVNGWKTSYALDLSGDMERILFEKDDLGNFTYFIHAPDLCYKMDQSGALACFHADAQANVIALSGASQANLAQYAYTPYGRVLGSTNLQSQISNPYLFVGSQGVMEEVPGLYFMRARYYSADAGVFLSTDPVKNIGPGWRSVAYGYANSNPLRFSDPTGELALVDTLVFAGVGVLKEVLVEVAFEVGQNLAEGKNILDFSNYSGARIAGAAVEGAVEGALLSFGVWGGGSSFAGNFAGRLVENRISSGSFSTGAALRDAAINSAVRFGVRKIVPNVSARNRFYFGAVKGRKPERVLSRLTGSHAVNDMLKSSIESSITTIGKGLLSDNGSRPGALTGEKTQNAAVHGQTLPPATRTKPSGPSVGGTTSDVGGGTYTVKAGDTLGNIGYANGTTATAIGNANGIKNLNLIYPGQVITLPPSSR